MLVWEPGDELAPVVACIERGGILAIPTESTYGLGADPCSARGCEAILKVKGRAASKALPIVVPDLETAFALGVSKHTPGLAATAAHWPAALSIVADLERPLAAAGGGDTIALRTQIGGEIIAAEEAKRRSSTGRRWRIAVVSMSMCSKWMRFSVSLIIRPEAM